jgi:hypothetical protein
MSIRAVSANHSKVKANQFKEHLFRIIFLSGKIFSMEIGSKWDS